MKTMKNIALLAVSAFMLTGCIFADHDANQTKTKLEEKDYTVSLYTEEEYEQLAISELLPSSIGMEYHLQAVDANQENIVIAWFFDTTDNCTTFNDIYSAWYTQAVKALGNYENVTSGQSNNACYAGTKAAIKAAGF